ncbi:MAG: 16S rRNA (cytosine(967)-C(5))-methyltransferase RsmB [Candidatus Abyssubacteria bacterium]
MKHKVDPIREDALKILRRTESALSFPKILIEYSVERMATTARERAFEYQLVMGVLRYRGTLDWALEKLCDSPVEQLTPWIRNILRMGLYQILFLDRIPQSAAVDESVKLAKRYGHRGTAGLVNAVLRNAKKNELLRELQSLDEESFPNLAAKYSHPQWLVELLVNEWGRPRAVEIMKRNNEIPPLTARCNTLCTSRDALLRKLESEGIRAGALPHVPEGIEFPASTTPWRLKAHKRGLFYLQDASSMLAASCLGAEPGQTILDACAGPGGKATHLAALMRNRGKIYALDLYEHRLKLVRDNARRLGVRIIEPRLQDATRDLAREYAGVDAALVDAPCSSLGVIRRRVDLKWRLRHEQIGQLADLQRSILERVAECVRPGGTLLYCTCTITREENTDIVEGFLASHPEFAAEKEFPARVARYTRQDGFVQVLPGQNNMDGFFIARLRRL